MSVQSAISQSTLLSSAPPFSTSQSVSVLHLSHEISLVFFEGYAASPPFSNSVLNALELG